MSHQLHRAGGKYCGSHTTIIPAAALLADRAILEKEVTKVGLGFIKAGLPSANGRRHVKFKVDGAGIVLAVRDNVSHQELRIYTKNAASIRLSLARYALDNGLNISFK